VGAHCPHHNRHPPPLADVSSRPRKLAAHRYTEGTRRNSPTINIIRTRITGPSEAALTIRRSPVVNPRNHVQMTARNRMGRRRASAAAVQRFTPNGEARAPSCQTFGLKQPPRSARKDQHNHSEWPCKRQGFHDCPATHACKLRIAVKAWIAEQRWPSQALLPVRPDHAGASPARTKIPNPTREEVGQRNREAHKAVSETNLSLRPAA